MTKSTKLGLTYTEESVEDFVLPCIVGEYDEDERSRSQFKLGLWGNVKVVMGRVGRCLPL